MVSSEEVTKLLGEANDSTGRMKQEVGLFIQAIEKVQKQRNVSYTPEQVKAAWENWKVERKL